VWRRWRQGDRCHQSEPRHHQRRYQHQRDGGRDVDGGSRPDDLDVDHDAGRSLVAALDAWSEETGARRLGATVLRHLSAPEARERYEFNLRLMAGRDDLDLGITPDVPGTPGLLPLDIGRVARVVGHLNVEATTQLAIRVLTGDPASARRG
jgi:DNA polymerase-1